MHAAEVWSNSFKLTPGRMQLLSAKQSLSQPAIAYSGLAGVAIRRDPV